MQADLLGLGGPGGPGGFLKTLFHGQCSRHPRNKKKRSHNRPIGPRDLASLLMELCKAGPLSPFTLAGWSGPVVVFAEA